MVFIMILSRKRTKFRLKIIKEKVFIQRELMNQINFDFLFRMGQSTELLISTFLSILNVDAKLFFVVIGMVKLFDGIMREGTIIIFTSRDVAKLLCILIL